MSGERLFLDTAYVHARIDRRDQYHDVSLRHQERVRNATEVWTTEAILVEVGNALSATLRDDAVRFIQQAYQTRNMRVLPVDTALLMEAVHLYRNRPDKQWGLTDCISFVVMRREGLNDALTSDHHFQQAGFRALLLEEP